MARLWIEPRGGFVHEEQVGIVDERARERQATLHSAGERLDSRFGARGQAREIEQLGNARPDGALREAEVAAVDEQVFADGEIGIEVVHLRHHSHARAGGPGFAGHGALHQLDRAAVGIGEA